MSSPNPTNYSQLVSHVRQDIYTTLHDLERRLANYEQTTQGVMGPFTIEAVADDLEECFDSPTSCTISRLAQQIRGFLLKAT